MVRQEMFLWDESGGSKTNAGDEDAGNMGEGEKCYELEEVEKSNPH